MEEKLKPEIELALYEKAHDIGIYPQSTTDKKGVNIKRTEWQNGWNSAVMRIGWTKCIYIEWFQKLPEPTKTYVGELLLAGAVDIQIQSKDKDLWKDDSPKMMSLEIELWVNCNDEFIWGCADSEDLPMDKVEEYYQMWAKDKETSHMSNSMLWVCRQRKMKPQKPIVDVMKKAGLWTEEWEALPNNEYDDVFPDECKGEIKIK
jgi:hypothetical protein